MSKLWNKEENKNPHTKSVSNIKERKVKRSGQKISKSQATIKR